MPMRRSGKRTSLSGAPENMPGHRLEALEAALRQPPFSDHHEGNMTEKIALITGASRGLGRSMALHLAARGVGIVGTYRSGQLEADSLKKEIESWGGKAEMIALDVTDDAGFPDFGAAVGAVLVSRFGRRRFDYLVNNAGMGLHATLVDTTREQFNALVNTHLRAPLFLMQTLLPLMEDGGRILNVSSGFVRFTLPGYGVYAAVKAAVEVMSRFMAVELGERKIRVNTIAPGAIATDFGGGSVRDNEAVNAYVAQGIALGRVGEPEDIGRAVAAILSDDLAWANGTSFDISGGQLL